MDNSLYKTVTTARGLKYNYYASPAKQGKSTLFFCHGFPSTSRDWRYFVPYFKERGYGLIIPDLLGFGDTDKPTDPSLYVSSRMSEDFKDILDTEGVEKAIAIGHDWGCKAVSRLATYHPERFTAYAFLAVPYVTPRAVRFEDLLEWTKKLVGYETYGYWLFCSEEDADSVIKNHIDSFISIVFPHDPEIWKTRLAPVGALKSSLLEDYTAPLPSYLSKDDAEVWKQTFLKNGFAAPTCWYKVIIGGMQTEDDRDIPPERALPPKKAPIFFGAAKNDKVCLAEFGYATFKDEAFKDHDITTREFDADHWLLFSKADDICRELESWIEGSVVEKASL